MVYLLDTCILSYLEDPGSPFNEPTLAALERLTDADEICLSILSIYELEYGLERAGAELAPEIERTKRQALESYRTLPLSGNGARIFADLKNRYRREKQREMGGKELAKHLARHTADLLIASSAIEHGATVVSNDHIFERLRQIFPALQVADWTVMAR